MYIQLLCHLAGDYLLQSHDMATKKTNQSKWAFYHCAMYTVPFLFITQTFWQLFLIASTHFLIDRYRLARYLVIWKNIYLGDVMQVVSKQWWNELYNTPTGYPDGTPAFLSVWLLIIADNTLHLIINFLILK